MIPLRLKLAIVTATTFSGLLGVGLIFLSAADDLRGHPQEFEPRQVGLMIVGTFVLFFTYSLLCPRDVRDRAAGKDVR